ncbi:hypothetical protein EV360DRAFT_57653 [Lentinula raphanica]|nr:hypothetical protein EV360DRAFT_57653 [Lentinula raphanica]
MSNYIHFCISHKLDLNPTPFTLSRYIAYTSRHIASGPKYLSGARHFLKQLYPHFDESRAHPLVQATIRGSKKVRADPVKRKPPLQISHIQLFCDSHHLSYDDLLFATLMSCGFYGCHCTRSWFESRLFAYVGRNFGGHSLRAGGAIFYARLGLSEHMIMVLGHWSSTAWKIYIRDNPTVRAELQLAALKQAQRS